MAAPRVTINDLPDKPTSSPADLIVVQDGTVTKKMTVQHLADGIVPPVPVFTSTHSGVVPGSGGSNVDFLRADGIWTVPPGSGGGGTGGLAGVIVQEDDTTRATAATTIDFGLGFDVTESPANEANVTLDLTEYSGGALPVTGGGTGATSAGTALTTLGGVPTTRSISTTAPLLISGSSSADLSANRTISVSTFGAASAGVVPPSGGSATNFLCANGTWVAPAGTGGGGVPTTRTISTAPPLAGGGPLSADLSLTVNNFTTSVAGTVPPSPGGTSTYLRADGTWSTVVGTPGAPGATGPAGIVQQATPPSDTSVLWADTTQVGIEENVRYLSTMAGTTYTLALSDRGKLIQCSASSAMTVTVPTNATVAFVIGTQIDLVQTGTGVLTISPFDGTVTVNATPSRVFRAQFSAASLIKTATNTWLLIGDLN